MKRAVMFAACVAVFAPGAVKAQGGDGYLFNEPRVTLKLETGYGFARASGDIYDFIIAEHTLDRRDFDSPYIGGELAIRLTSQFDLALAVGYQQTAKQSEFRDYVDEDFLPILQMTELEQVPLTASVRFFPLDRGRKVGRFAWVPRTVSPFVSGGVGLLQYSLQQFGDFVDYETEEIFTDNFRTDDSAFLGQAGAGVNISISQQILFSLEGRYRWSSGDLEGDFVGFDPIDLNGVQLIGGLAVRF